MTLLLEIARVILLKLDLPSLWAYLLYLTSTVYTLYCRLTCFRLKAGIIAKVGNSSGLAKFFFDQAFASKKAAMSVGRDTPIWNAIVFKKFKAALGGNVRFVVSGGAPLSKECGEFLKV